MNTSEAAGHIAVVTFCGALGLFGGLPGILIGIVIFLAWTMLTKK